MCTCDWIFMCAFKEIDTKMVVHMVVPWDQYSSA
jgi:hypothetical protein